MNRANGDISRGDSILIAYLLHPSLLYGADAEIDANSSRGLDHHAMFYELNTSVFRIRLYGGSSPKFCTNDATILRSQYATRT
jgi:hypothetical protein